MTAALDVRELRGGYGGMPVVHGLSFEVEAGAILAVLGANGAGKSTTLNTVAGLLPPLGGEVSLHGKPVGGRPAHVVARHGLALVPQSRAVVHRLTVAENLRLLPRRRSESLDTAFGLFPDLRPLAHRRAGLLSGGEQQMLALARALSLHPTVLLVDEMSAGLAPQLVERLFVTLTTAARRHGMAVVMVEQHAALALAAADRALVLARGRQAILDSTATIRSHPELLESTYLGETSDESAR